VDQHQEHQDQEQEQEQLRTRTQKGAEGGGWVGVKDAGRRTQDEGQATGVNVPAKNGRNDWGYVCSSDKKNQVNWSWGAIFSPFFLFGPVLISSKCRFKR